MKNKNTEKNPKQIYSDEQYIAKWVEMLNKFKAIIKDKPKPASVDKQLCALADEARETPYLTPPQREGIIARCDNYLNGSYIVK